MPKFIKSNGSPTVYSLRRALGMKSRKASGFNSCVGAYLKGRKYSKPPAGTGGWKNPEVRAAFKEAVAACKGRGTTARDISLAQTRFLRETGRGG